MYNNSDDYSGRNAIVRKSNALIHMSRFNLSALEQKILAYIISSINPYDTDFKHFRFLLLDFCQLCGIVGNGTNYAYIRKVIKDLSDKSIWIGNKLYRWIDTAEVIPISTNGGTRSGELIVTMSESIRPFLIQLTQQYTQYEIIYVLGFKRQYSFRMYELIKSVHYHPEAEYTREYTLDELRDRLGVDEYDKAGNIVRTKYTTWQHLNDKAIAPSVAEINKYTDKIVTYEPIRQKNKIVAVRFTISTKSLPDRIHARNEVIAVLDAPKGQQP